MTVYNVGSDHSGNGDEDCINKVCEVLSNAGHTANNLGVTPNLEGRLNKGTGTEGVFLVNGVCLGTIVSCAKMAESGGCDRVWFGFPKPLMGGSDFKSLDDLKTKKLHLADDDTFSPQDVQEMSGKYTPDEVFGMYDKVSYVWGDTCEEVANGILNGGENGSMTSSQGSTSIMSGWEALTDLLKPLDGDAMMVVRGDTVVVKRIYPPEATKLWVYEGINVVDDSVTVSDYSPEIYNTFTILWGETFENEMELCFEKHKELFGERKTEVYATYEVPIDEAPQEVTDTDADTQSQETDDGGGDIWSTIGNFMLGVVLAPTNPSYAVNPMINAVTLNDESREGDGGSEDEPTTMDIPIVDESEAYLFGLKQLGKERRKDGHKIECKVIGSKYWEVGEWCKVYLPTFHENTIMFISKVSHESSADGEWLTSLTLVDYPPSLGSGQSNTPQGNTETEEVTEQGALNATNPNTEVEEYMNDNGEING